MTKMLTIQDFFRMFPDDDTACRICSMSALGRTISARMRRDGQVASPVENAGLHLQLRQPHSSMAGTPFLRTRTSLQKWFFAMFLFTTTRNGVAAKELQRQLG